MSDAKNLNDFFANTKKKTKKQQKKPAAAAPTDELPAKPEAAASAAPAEETKAVEATQASPAPAEAAATAPAQAAAAEEAFADSSDEESIVLNEGRSKIKDRKEVEASRKNKQEESTSGGWGLGSKLGSAMAQKGGATGGQQADVSVSKAAARGPPTLGGGIKFGGAKPSFTRSKKGTVMDQSEFPDLDASSNAQASAPKTKAEGAVFGGFTSTTTAGRRNRDGDDAAPEERKQATKPVFRGKAKLGGGASNEDVANSRMNYDFSSMGLSQAKGKRAEGEAGADGEGQQRRGPPRISQQASASNDFDEDFDVVTDKKRVPNRRQFGDSAFSGQGKPSFSRGGSDKWTD